MQLGSFGQSAWAFLIVYFSCSCSVTDSVETSALRMIDGELGRVKAITKHLQHCKKATESPHTDSLSLRVQV